MKSKVELTDNICKVSKNGDFSFTPTARQFTFLLLVAIVLLALGLVVKQLLPATAILIFAIIIACSLRWASQPKTLISLTSSMIVWSKWFHKLQYPFKNVSSVNVFLDRREYAWSTHFVDRRKNIVEMNAKLEIILENRRLFIGHISGENAEVRALSLAKSLAKAIGAPVSNTGYISRYL